MSFVRQLFSFITSFSKRRSDRYVSVRKFPEPHAGSKNVSDANLFWNSSNFFISGTLHLNCSNTIKFLLQIFQKKRTNNFMNIFNRCIMHSSRRLVSGFNVDSNTAPNIVGEISLQSKSSDAFVRSNSFNFLCKRWYLNSFISK